MKWEERVTEQRNPHSKELHAMSTMAILKAMNEEDKRLAYVVQALLPEIERIVDAIVPKLQQGGRLLYIGSGTSGRIGMLDAVECPPTFMIAPDVIQTIMAGGDEAFFQAMDELEDDAALGKRAIVEKQVSRHDIVIGISASGTTPYTIGAIQQANAQGALTVSVTCNHHAELSMYTDYAIEAVVGAEIITGSTRLKSATVQKMILNMISTVTMVKLGKVHENFMVDMQAATDKQKMRAVHIVTQITEVSEAEALQVLEAKAYRLKPAILSILTSASDEEIEAALQAHQGILQHALDALVGK